jgi:hypothetical protein
LEIWRRNLATSAPLELQAIEPAGAEFVDFDPQPLEHADVEIAQRRRALRIEGQVLTTLRFG